MSRGDQVMACRPGSQRYGMSGGLSLGRWRTVSGRVHVREPQEEAGIGRWAERNRQEEQRLGAWRVHLQDMRAAVDRRIDERHVGISTGEGHGVEQTARILVGQVGNEDRK
jgi:hypothetical protein